MSADSGVRDGEFLVALDVSERVNLQSSIRPQFAIRVPQYSGSVPVPVVRIASLVHREWLKPTRADIEHRYDASSGRVRAFAVDRYDALVLAERHVPVDPEIAANLLAAAWLERGPGDGDARLLRRLRFAGHDADVAALVRTAAYGVKSLDEIDLTRALDPEIARALDRDAPDALPVPSGRSARLDYADDGSVSASVKLQELFGLAETPRIGSRREPVVLHLLAPNGRPVQVTRDLRSFWDRTYPEVRKELRGRYPRHPWPDDPWNATPTHRTTKR